MFWSLSLREAFREFAAAGDRVRDDRARDVSIAWHTALFASQAFGGKLEPLHRLLGRMQQSSADKRQTVGQMRTALAVLSGQYGIPLRKGGKVIH